MAISLELRFVVLPIQYPRVWEMYKKAMGQSPPKPLPASGPLFCHSPMVTFCNGRFENVSRHCVFTHARTYTHAPITASFWTIDEVDLSKDAADWAKMTVSTFLLPQDPRVERPN